MPLAYFAMPVSATSAVGRRIKRAREDKGLTQGELAGLIGSRQTTVSYWESGKRSPDVVDLVALADALEVEVGDFFAEAEEQKPARVLLRAEATLRPFGNLIGEIESFAVGVEEMDPLPREIRVETTDPVRAAQQVLAQAGIVEPPIPIVQLAERCGVRVEEASFSDEISGVVLELTRGPVIGFNADHVATRQRFTIAHELGHHLLNHHDHFHIDLAEGAEHGNRPGYDWRDERSANEFAAQVLMPDTMVVRAHAENGDLTRLAKRFKVSHQAMGWRLVNLGLLG
jgi:Zn-dependent peptidase ImmA (M78 family)/DNA-binding XRE family transcriptional regulator